MKDNKSVFLDTLQEREPNHKRNLKLDEVIAQLCDLLQPIQNRVTAIEGRKPQWPVSMIIGCPRSGTTLLLQFMAKTGNFAYPSNLLARFAYAPYIGILIQEMIFNKNYWHQNDFYDVESDFEFSSDLGKSKGVLAPNEFFHFWRRFMPNFEHLFHISPHETWLAGERRVGITFEAYLTHLVEMLHVDYN